MRGERGILARANGGRRESCRIGQNERSTNSVEPASSIRRADWTERTYAQRPHPRRMSARARRAQNPSSSKSVASTSTPETTSSGPQHLFTSAQIGQGHAKLATITATKHTPKHEKHGRTCIRWKEELVTVVLAIQRTTCPQPDQQKCREGTRGINISIRRKGNDKGKERAIRVDYSS